MTDPAKSSHVFISSTFRDMHAERDHLVTVVYPELRERMALLGITLFDVDLRWGVPKRTPDGEQSNSWEYCRKWIERSAPFFVGILGQRYGYIPRPAEIKDEDERRRWAGRSITDMEMCHAVLERGDFYRRSYFYLRSTPAGVDAADPGYPEFVDGDLQQKVADLKERVRRSRRPVREYSCRWNVEAKQFEDLDAFGRALLEDLWSGVLREPRFQLQAAWRETRGREPEDDPLYTDESKPIPEEVWREIVRHARPKPAHRLDEERERMAAFAAERIRWFQGRERELGLIDRFVAEERETRLAVVKAVAGRGKSALLAKATGELRQKGYRVVAHYVGATETSTDVRSLLLRLHQELSRAGVEGGFGEGELPDLNRLKTSLAERLRAWDGEGRIVLVLDGVNQLTGGHDLTWLPTRLGAGIRLVLSCIDDPASPPGSPETRVLAALRKRQTEPVWIDLEPLSRKQIRRVVVRYLDEYCKELHTDHVARISETPQAGNPLYLRVMLDELRTLSAGELNEEVPERVRRMSREHPDTVSLFEWVLEGLEVFGERLVRLWSQYLALGRAGMTSRELADLIYRKERRDEDRKAALRTERGLRRYLQQRGAQLDFFHGQLRAAVERRYPVADAVPLHVDVGRYFQARWNDGDSDRHVVSELPHHLIEARLWTELLTVLADRAFRQRKIELIGPNALLDDFDGGFRAAKDEHPRTAEQLVEILGSELARLEQSEDGVLNLENVNAWLAYLPDTSFHERLLRWGVPDPRWNDRPAGALGTNYEALSRAYLVEYLRRDGAHEEALELAGDMPEDVTDRKVLKALSLMAYQVGYVHFRRSDLDEAAKRMHESASYADQAEDPVGHWISRCVESRIEFLAGKISPKSFAVALEEARRVFDDAAGPPRSDPRAQRWSAQGAMIWANWPFSNDDLGERTRSRLWEDRIRTIIICVREAFSG